VNRAKLVHPGAVRISALDLDAVKRLREQILDYFKTKMQVFEVVVPYTEGKLLAKIQEFGSINSTKYLEKGVFMQVKMDTGLAQKLGVTRYATAKQDD
jgi:50S ribosomal subunit-associated GTPase HflX